MPRSKPYKQNLRPDHLPGHRMQYEKNRKRILATQDTCALCGKPVDKRIKYPDPMCATIDHIIPVSKGGHPSAIDNLQLAHLKCNRKKWDDLPGERNGKNVPYPDTEGAPYPDPRKLPLSIDWRYLTDGNDRELWENAEAIRARGYVLTARGVFKAGTGRLEQ